MKLQCVKNKIVSGVARAEKITGKNLTLPVLGCLLLKAEKNNLKIIATNLDLGVEIDIPATVEEEGIIAVPGGVLNNLISSDYRSEKISLETNNDNLNVLTDVNSTVIKAQKSDDFPSIPKLRNENRFVVDAKKLIKGLKAVWYSSSTSNIKPELSSILVYGNLNDLIFVATDSFRLAEMKINLEKNQEDFSQILIPFKNIPEIMRVFDGVEGNIKIYLTKTQIAFEYDNIYLTSRIIDGIFPDYQQLIPKNFTTEITLLKEDLMNSLKVSNIFSDKFNKIVFKIDPENSIFEISSKNNDIGENKAKVEGVLKGESLEISFSQKYIMECFQSINTDSLVLQFNGLNKPLVIHSVPNTGFTYLVMPMNK